MLVSGLDAGNYWTPGGKTIKGETNQESLKRELKEELNIKAISMKLFYSYEIINKKEKVKKNMVITL